MSQAPAVTSIYRQALGEEFGRLHPRIQERFGVSSADELAQIGRGTMDEVWFGRPYTLPFLALGAWRRIMFPSRGHSVPFTIENYAYLDSLGRETVTWIRTFAFPQVERRFYERGVGFRFPMLFSGVANVHEWFDDELARFRIEVEVTNPRWGRLFGYRGWFDIERYPSPAVAVPDRVRPRREEQRE